VELLSVLTGSVRGWDGAGVPLTPPSPQREPLRRAGEQPGLVEHSLLMTGGLEPDDL